MTNYVYIRASELGLELEDAKKRIALEVTNADIRQARIRNSKACVFANAARKLPGVKAAYFFKTTCWLEYARKMVRYILPTSVQREIVAYDRAGIIAAGTYHLTPPGKTQSLGYIRKNPGKYRREAKKTRHITAMVRTTAEPA